MPSEHDLIARYLAPLAGEGSLGLGDDVGLLGERVVTKDLIVCGVHYRPEDPLDRVAQKAIRVNVSDLVAKGCRPEAVLIGMVWPATSGEGAFSAFCVGLSRDLSAYRLELVGGDTTRAPGLAGPTVSVTMTGRPYGPGIVPRGGARPGDAVYVGGTIGDARLALDFFAGHAAMQAFGDSLSEAYQRPAPPLAAAQAIAAHATAAADVSDGLLIDACRLARASRVQVEILARAVPLSAAGRAFVEGGGDIARLVTGGDDYQPVLTVRPAQESAFLREAAMAGARFTRVGTCRPGQGLFFAGDDGEDLTPKHLGYSHF